MSETPQRPPLGSEPRPGSAQYPFGPAPFPPLIMPESGPGNSSRSALWVGLAVIMLLGTLVMAVVLITTLGKKNDGGSLLYSGSGKVAVIKLEGLILDPQDVIKQIVEQRKDQDVKAVVLRINSPGGAVAPSQEIFSEVKKLKAAKPVVVSMGAVAASGGYYVACPATRILANPGTITGSISVIMQTVNLQGLMQWMKVDHEVFKSGKFKDTGSPYRQMTREEREYLNKFILDVHQQFVQAVSEGRSMELDKVNELADGRIYTGVQALELGLVDQIGDIYDAIDVAAKLAGIKGEPKVIWPREPKMFPFFGSMGSIAGSLADTLKQQSQPFQVMYILPYSFQ